MAWLSKLVTAIGLGMLAHTCYSAQEYTTLQSARLSSSSSSVSMALPVDIVVETVAALFVASLGLVLGTQHLKPIQWHIWAGKIEREGKEGALATEDDADKNYMGNPFRYLETRPGFIDIRKQRREFEAWAKKIDGKNII